MTAATDERALSGAAWTLLAIGFTRGIGLGTTLVLARVLEPRDFGVVAIAALILVTVGAVAGMGFPGAVVVGRGNREMRATILALTIVAGLAAASLVAVGAGEVASIFEVDRLDSVLATMSPLLLVGGVAAFYEAVLQRAMRFRARFATQLVQALASAGIAIPAALAGAGVWSLVAGQLGGTLAYGIALLAFTGSDLRPRLHRRLVMPAFASARGFLAHDMIVHVQHNLDVGATAYVLGAKPTGYYAMAFRFSELPHAAFTQPVAAVAFPALARSHRQAEPTRQLGLQLLLTVGLFACPACVLISATAAPLTEALVGRKWAPMAGALAVLGGWAAFRQVEVALGWFLNATGRAGANAAVSAAVTLPLLPALLLAADANGITGVAWVMLAGAMLTSLILMLRVRSLAQVPLRAQLSALAPIGVGCTACWLAAHPIAEALNPHGAVPAVLTAVAVGLVVYVVAIRIVDRATLSAGRAFVAAVIAELRRAR